MKKSGNIEGITEHLFRHEYGKLVSSLTRLFGINKLDIAEDIVQDTLVSALTKWRFQAPENPKAWLYKVAKNKAIDYLRKSKHTTTFSDEYGVLLQSEWSISNTINKLFLDEEIEDNQLHMMFASCSPEISWESQVSLILKTLCGFSIKEIARAFLTTESSVNKRLYRAKEKLRKTNFTLKTLNIKDIKLRLDTVLKTIYLLFNEGYNSNSDEKIIRKDLCLEAMRLCLLLIDKSSLKDSKSAALMALMCYHSARFEARISNNGDIITMENQDRDLWNSDLIEKGDYFMSQLDETNEISIYHLEAGISGYYCHSNNYNQINWKGILLLYNKLQTLTPSPIVKLNRAVVLGKVNGAENGIRELIALKGLNNHYLYHSVLGTFYRECEQKELSHDHFKRAFKLAPTSIEKKFIKDKLKT